MEILFGRNQLPVFISFFICGIISGVFCDLLRIKRRILFSNFIILFFDDLVFFGFCTLLIIFNAYCFNNGNMKWYEIPVMISGFALYRKTLSRVFTGVCFTVIDFLKKLIRIAFSPIRRLISYVDMVLKHCVERLRLMLFLLKKKQAVKGWQF